MIKYIKQYLLKKITSTKSLLLISKLLLCPGSIGSLLCYPLYYIVLYYSYSWQEFYIKIYVFLITFTIIGAFIIKMFKKITHIHDHQCIIIDEIIGQILTIIISFQWLISINNSVFTLYLQNQHLRVFSFAFILFRLFDICKISVIKAVDNTLKCTMSVVLDDIIASFFASIIILILYHIILI